MFLSSNLLCELKGSRSYTSLACEPALNLRLFGSFLLVSQVLETPNKRFLYYFSKSTQDLVQLVLNKGIFEELVTDDMYRNLETDARVVIWDSVCAK